MSTLDKIKAGLRKRETSGNFTSLQSYIGAPMTRQALNEAVHNVIMKRDYLRQAADRFAKAFEARESAIRAEVSNMGWAEEERQNGTKLKQDLMGDTARRAELTKRLNRARKQLADETAAARTDTLKAINEIKAKVDAVRNVWADPVAMLGRETAGDSALRIYRDNLEGSRPATLRARIHEAVLSGNKPMVAACLAILDGMKKEDKEAVDIDRQECAAFVLGDIWPSALHHLAALDLAVLEAERAEAEIESGSVARQKRVEIGLLQMELAALSGELSFDDLVEAERQGINPETMEDSENDAGD